MLINVNTDNYFIAQRIKEIDYNYYIVFNTARKKFEIHNKSQGNNTYCLTVPYSTLDARTLDFVNETKIENIQKLMEKIEKNNKKLEKN